MDKESDLDLLCVVPKHISRDNFFISLYEQLHKKVLARKISQIFTTTFYFSQLQGGGYRATTTSKCICACYQDEISWSWGGSNPCKSCLLWSDSWGWGLFTQQHNHSWNGSSLSQAELGHRANFFVVLPLIGWMQPFNPLWYQESEWIQSHLWNTSIGSKRGQI